MSDVVVPDAPTVIVAPVSVTTVVTGPASVLTVPEPSTSVVTVPGGVVVVNAGTGPQGPPGPSGGGGSGGAVVQQDAIAAVALGGHRAVTPLPDGTLTYADNVSTPVNAPLWLTTGAAVQGATVTAVTFGDVTEPSWAWTPGPVYLGANGALTQTAPTAPGAVFLAQIGTATGPTTVFVDRYPSVVLI